MKRIKVEKKISYEKKILILAIFPLLLFIISITLGFNGLSKGLVEIIKHPGILVTDYILVGGYYPNLFNVALLGFLNLLIIYKMKIPVNGLIFAGYFVAIGFAFFGKTVVNVLPIYLGGYLYAKREKINFKGIFGVMMFTTGLAPVVSYLLFNPQLSLWAKIFFGMSSGIITGFIMTPLSSHMLKFHDGYNLYNIGFTAGILGNIFAAVFRGKGLILERYYLLSSDYDFSLKLILTFTFVIFLFLGYYINKNSFVGYDILMASSGRLISDFILTEGFGLTLLNAGILGLLSLALVSFLGTPLNGPLIAGIFTVFGFGAFGKHPVNTVPIVLGVVFASYLNMGEYNNFSVALTALFGTTLAPIAGVHGPFIGIIAGFFHLFVVNNVGIIHGGMNLYNNGFSGGLVAGVFVPLIHKFNLGEKFYDRIY